jgi:hypothetical protein
VNDVRSTRTPVEIAENVQRRRTRVMRVSGVMFLLWQGVFWNTRFREGHNLDDAVARLRSSPQDALRHVDIYWIGSFFFWAASLLFVLAAAGGLFRGRAMRALIDDEVTRAHRASAYAWGFWAMIVTCFAAFVISMFEPLGLMDTLHMLLTFGIAAALVRFVMLERRAERSADRA